MDIRQTTAAAKTVEESSVVSIGSVLRTARTCEKNLMHVLVRRAYRHWVGMPRKNFSCAVALESLNASRVVLVSEAVSFKGLWPALSRLKPFSASRAMILTKIKQLRETNAGSRELVEVVQ